MASRLTVESSRLSVREADRLVLIADVLVGDDRDPCLKLRADKFHRFKHDCAAAGQSVSVYDKKELLIPVFVLRSKSPHLISVRICHLSFKLLRLFTC